jgi:hypothetical protein
MNVDHPERRDSEYLGPQDVAVRDHDAEIRLEVP